MTTEQVKAINDKVIADMQADIDLEGCGCCYCYRDSVGDMLRQHTPITDKGNVWDDLSEQEKALINYRMKNPYKGIVRSPTGHICCGP